MIATSGPSSVHRVDDHAVAAAGRGHVLVVDAANVVGARPDGWWRDRAGAAGRLLDGLAAARDAGDVELGGRVVVVLEGRAGAAAEDVGRHAGVEAVVASGDGDTAVVRLVEGLAGADVLVVTSDRDLRRRVEALGARVRGAGWLRDRLDRVG